MKIETTPIQDLLVLEPIIFKDPRGYFFESYNSTTFKNLELDYNFVQDNESVSSKGTLRGLHLQIAPKAQAKLVRCIQGSVFDVAIDLRKNSSTYKSWFGIELTGENKKQLLIPKGFAHGFLTLSDFALMSYKCDNNYSKKHEFNIHFSEFGIQWPKMEYTLSEKDNAAPPFTDLQNKLCF